MDILCAMHTVHASKIFIPQILRARSTPMPTPINAYVSVLKQPKPCGEKERLRIRKEKNLSQG